MLLAIFLLPDWAKSPMPLWGRWKRRMVLRRN
jgi:hypothetical protein